MTQDYQRSIVEPGEGFFSVKSAERVLFMPAGPFARIFAARFFAKKVRHRPYPAGMYRLKRSGKEIDLVGPAMGAPVAVMVEEMLIAGGAKKIIAFGFAGSIDPGLKIGDTYIINESLCDEGTSRCYDPEVKSAFASEPLTNALKQGFEAKGINYQVGKAMCTDGFFRETKDKLDAFKPLGARAVEMEMSALYTVGKFRGVEVTGMVVISDEHTGEEWKSGFKSPSMFLKFHSAAEVAVSVLSK
jgi:uridine phosphorylase